MVEHIVLFKTRADATPEQREAMRQALLSLQDRVPGIVQATCGYNFSERNQGYDLGFVVRFADRAALDAYLPHPAHQEVVERYVRPISEGVLVVDYEI